MKVCDKLIDASTWSITKNPANEEACFDDAGLETRGTNWWTALRGELVSDNLLEDETGREGKRLVNLSWTKAFADSVKLFILSERCPGR